MQGIEVTQASAHSSVSGKKGEGGSVVVKDLEPRYTGSPLDSSVTRCVSDPG